MLRTIELTRTDNQLLRVTGITLFVLLLALAAQVEIWFGGPVPFTLQVLAVLMAGMVLGRRDGAIATLGYVVLIRFNLPIAAGGAGASALSGTTAGYLFGFIPAAYVAGWLVELGACKIWQRWLAGMVGVAIIYAFGLPVLKIVTDGTWSQVWQWGAVPFLGLDAIKALLAAGMVESMRAWLLRSSDSICGEKVKNKNNSA